MNNSTTDTAATSWYTEPVERADLFLLGAMHMLRHAAWTLQAADYPLRAAAMRDRVPLVASLVQEFETASPLSGDEILMVARMLLNATPPDDPAAKGVGTLVPIVDHHVLGRKRRWTCDFCEAPAIYLQAGRPYRFRIARLNGYAKNTATG